MTEISKALNEYARNAGLTLPGPASEEDWLKRVVEVVLQTLLDAEATSVIGASRYERTEERVNHRNGRRKIEPFRTRLGNIAPSSQKLRKGSYYPSFLDARKPVERALVIAIGVGANGRREILDFKLGPSEEEAFWLQFLRGMISLTSPSMATLTASSHIGCAAIYTTI